MNEKGQRPNTDSEIGEMAELVFRVCLLDWV